MHKLLPLAILLTISIPANAGGSVRPPQKSSVPTLAYSPYFAILRLLKAF